MSFKYSFLSVMLFAYFPFPLSACLPVIQIFFSFSYPVSLTSFPSACLLVCRSNMRLFQLSCLPIFLSQCLQCLLACLSFEYSFLSVILSAYLPFPVSACLPVVQIFVSFSYPVCLSSLPVPACQSQSVSLPVSLLLTFTYICI
jgi:hypothetical protein